VEALVFAALAEVFEEQLAQFIGGRLGLKP